MRELAEKLKVTDFPQYIHNSKYEMKNTEIDQREEKFLFKVPKTGKNPIEQITIKLF